MAAVEIGSLVVRLTGDARTLDKAVRDSTRGLKDFDSTAQRIGRSVRASALIMTAAFTAAATSIAVLGKAAISEADKISKLAQQVGITTEELSALRFAAEKSNISVDELARSMQNVARNMQAAATQGPNDFSRALESLNISFKNADGSFRSTTDLISDVADKFEFLRDSSGKTALAMKVFGEEMGPRLIPLLNSGSAGIQEITDKARSFGSVLSTQTGKEAEEFDNKLADLSETLRGVANRILTVSLPVLNDLFDTMLLGTDTVKDAAKGWDGVADAIRSAAKVGVVASETFGALFGTLMTIGTIGRNLYEGDLDRASVNFQRRMEALQNLFPNISFLLDEIDKAGRRAGEGLQSAAGYLSGFSAIMKNALSDDAPIVDIPVRLKDAFTAAHDAAREMLSQLLDTSTVPFEQKMAAVTKAVRDGRIGFMEYGKTVKKINDENKANIEDVATTTANALTAVFQDNKAAAIAAAIINTAVGITEAMKLPPPYDLIKAGLVAATGAAQIAAIRSTTKSGGGGGGTSAVTSGSSGSSSVSSDDSGGGSGAGNVSTLHVTGLGPQDLFNGEMVRDLSDMILQYQRDGGKVLFQGL